ncbi:MAG: PHP domain-containing protein [candidate division Zixibacteria bacterium]|nr:PHP domain-containing protein [candidate division Zixibacteria bacterium]
MTKYVDLHMHTSCSDGLYSAQKLLDIVRTKNLDAFAVTDHDTIEGYRQMSPLLTGSDPELVPGVELSVNVDGDDMHMLAYLFDPEHPRLTDALEEFKEKRSTRGFNMVKKLQKLGLQITFEDVLRIADGAVIGRPHIAETLLQMRQVSTMEEAFRKYIGFDGPGYEAKASWIPRKAIDLVHEAGGVAVMAHAGIAEMHRHIPHLAPLGLDGIEVFHYAHSTVMITQLLGLAETYSMIITGGSDFHGRSGREVPIGALKVPIDCLENLKRRVESFAGDHGSAH